MNKYIKKDWLNKLDRIEDPNPERNNTFPKEVRLHRAERLTDFPEDFFNDFIKSINQEDIRLYPEVTTLKKNIGKYFNINYENILLFSGSIVCIKTFMENFCIPNKSTIISEICYPFHYIFPKIENTKIEYIKHDIIESNNTILKMKINLSSLIEKINENICCICIANPNSPIGDILSLDEIERILKKALIYNIPVLVDEAYIEFSDAESSIKLLNKYDNLVISKTFSKGFGCAGLRCGYLISNDKIIESIKKIMYQHEITHLTSKFCSHLLDNYNIVYDYTKSIKKEREQIFKLLKLNKIKYVECQLNTISIKPNNIHKLFEYFQKINIRCKLRNINNEIYLVISLFESFHKHKIFETILNYHNN